MCGEKVQPVSDYSSITTNPFFDGDDHSFSSVTGVEFSEDAGQVKLHRTIGDRWFSDRSTSGPMLSAPCLKRWCLNRANAGRSLGKRHP
jgi:hypothetical protein